MSELEKQVKFFNIFKEVATNNLSLIQGFKKWTDKIYFTIEGNDLLIHVPAVLVKYGNSERMFRSKKKNEADKIMKKNNYTYLEFVIKNSCMIYASTVGKQVGNFFEKGSGNGK